MDGEVDDGEKVVTYGLSLKPVEGFCKQRAKPKVELPLNLRGISLDQLYDTRPTSPACLIRSSPCLPLSPCRLRDR